MDAFGDVVDQYDASRPDHPEALFDELEPLANTLVLEGGAGTGIATRALLRRGARAYPFDISRAMLERAVLRTPGLPAVVADGALLPFRDRCADMICFAQSWHWLDERQRSAEAARVLRRGGRWAGWWSLASADGEGWFEDYWTAMGAATSAQRPRPGYDAVADLRRSALFDIGEKRVVPWTREVTVERWLTEEASKSYIASLAEPARRRLIEEIEQIVRARFPDGVMEVPYETRLWTAVVR